MASRGPRLAVGSSAWITAERSSALQLAQSEVEEFGYSAGNEFEWLNEHMRGIFDENQINVADIFKTPGKLRGRTPATVRHVHPGVTRMPLSNLFSATPNGSATGFSRPGIIERDPGSLKSHLQSPPLRHQQLSPIQLHGSPAQKPLMTYPRSPALVDSGYHGSQSDGPFPNTGLSTQVATVNEIVTAPRIDRVTFASPGPVHRDVALPRAVPLSEDTSQTTVEEQTAKIPSTVIPRVGDTNPDPPQPNALASSGRPSLEKDLGQIVSEAQTWDAGLNREELEKGHDLESNLDALQDGSRSGTDGSSPFRPVLRKSSLAFASLPAREPMMSNKSIGAARVSRTSLLEQNSASHYNRFTAGKSIGGSTEPEDDQDHDHDHNLDQSHRHDPDKLDLDECPPQLERDVAAHNMAHTQRLQDQINMLGQSQPKASQSSSRLMTSFIGTQPPASRQSKDELVVSHTLPPNPRESASLQVPGAFSESSGNGLKTQVADAHAVGESVKSRQPACNQSGPVERVKGKPLSNLIGEAECISAHDRQPDNTSTFSITAANSPLRPTNRPTTTSIFTEVDAFHQDGSGHSVNRIISVSTRSVMTGSEGDQPDTPPKSPSRNIRESPLRLVKNKLSSILKSSKGLLASGAALSAEGKSAMLTPSSLKLGILERSTESLLLKPKCADPTYPDLTQQVIVAESLSPVRIVSPSRSVMKRTRASTERDKEERRKDKETKRLAEQMEKLQKAREKEREKARVFSREKEGRLVAAESSKAEPAAEKLAHTPAASPAKRLPELMKMSPQKSNAAETLGAVQAATGLDDATTNANATMVRDVDMVDAPPMMAPFPESSPAARTVTKAQGVQSRQLKRPIKPSREAVGKAKQAPTVIRVNMGSQHFQHHQPSNGTLSANLHETLTVASSSQAPSQPGQITRQASRPMLNSKASSQSLKSSVSSTGRPKALDLAARKKEQEEREATRRREARVEMGRKRAANQDEERKLADAKKSDQRQQSIATEKARQITTGTKAATPAAATRPHAVEHDHGIQDKKPKEAGRPGSRLNVNATPSVAGSQPHEELGRPIKVVLSTTAKAMLKRPIEVTDGGEEGLRRNNNRPGTCYQSKDGKRRRTSQGPDSEYEADSQPGVMLKGPPPVRPSGGFKKDAPAPSKSFFGGFNGRDLFKATVAGQHAMQAKATHPLDMAQLSKGAIPFAANPLHATTTTSGQQHVKAGGGPPTQQKTPVRIAAAAAARSATKAGGGGVLRSSPRVAHAADAMIELPEIDTEDEDEYGDGYDDDDGKGGSHYDKPSSSAAAAAAAGPSWAGSPDLRRALMQQEMLDPAKVFGAPGPLVMEEVFSKSRERWHKFRARTSSANWTGPDRLTEEEIRRDLKARDRLRREGRWTYDLCKDIV